MKKVTIYLYRTYGLIGLISLTTVLSTTTPALTQLAGDSPIGQTPIPTSNLIWPTQGFISQGFRKYQHEGIDIAGASGTPIVAVASGTVIKAGWDDWGLGNAITIKHLDGSTTVYGHNRRLLVSKGQQIIQGQIIAEMG
ncbi:MAG: M23 family metallopeptidase, partial [Tolypothrix sp. Co-bin9]|nr:M23 family metallopeptidase [Tolypothrix sp. Co-bin9]